jgi:hypothetical protein
VHLNADGKFIDRLIPAAIAAGFAVAIAIGGQMLGWWSTSFANDREAVRSIERLDKELAEVKAEQRAQRIAAEAERQKTAELSADMRNVLRSTARIESLLDRYLMPRQPGQP